MNNQPNMRPYGVKGAGVDPTAGTGHDDFWAQRAKAKLAAYRAAPNLEQPAGRSVATIVAAIIISSLVGLPFLLIAFGFVTDGDFGTAFVFLLFPTAFFGICALLFVVSKPSSPKAVLNQYFKSICRKKFKRAKSLVLSHDFDNVQRLAPHINGLGDAGGHGYRFNLDHEFQAYWTNLVLDQPMPVAQARISNVQINQAAPDVAVATFRIRIQRNTQLWILLFLVLGVIALLIMAATNKRTDATITKVLVRVGDEWKLFNAEWQGAAEHDIGWLFGV